MNIQVNFTDEFKSIIHNRAIELINSGEPEGVINDSFYGKLKIFIDNKPASVIFSAQVDGKDVYVGGEGL
ncbi:MAG: hypothetical protein R3B39_00855 [Candidatus Paceibacterota bacterium]